MNEEEVRLLLALTAAAHPSISLGLRCAEDDDVSGGYSVDACYTYYENEYDPEDNAIFPYNFVVQSSSISAEVSPCSSPLSSIAAFTANYWHPYVKELLL